VQRQRKAACTRAAPRKAEPANADHEPLPVSPARPLVDLPVAFLIATSMMEAASEKRHSPALMD
jgi:hypothetical protein